jgi:acyl-CoA thioester hydrolase
MQEARLQFYQSLGFQNEISFEDTIGQIIAEVNVQYKAEAFMGDVLTFHIGINNVVKYGFDIIYRIVNKNKEKEVAVGITRNLCFDYSTRKIASIPTALSEKLKKFLYDDTRSSTTS